MSTEMKTLTIGSNTYTIVDEEARTTAGQAVKTINGVAPDESGNVAVESSSVTIDTTLTLEGQAADSKAVGDAISSLSEEMASTVRTVNGQAPDENGNVNVEGGGGAGTPGGYYTPSVTQPDDNTMRVSYAASQEGMADVPDVDVTLPDGPVGATPNLQVGEVTTLEPGSAATASMGGTAENPILNMGIPAGQPGATPVKGTDYWTAEDQQAIVNDVLAALPTWEGGSY